MAESWLSPEDVNYFATGRRRILDTHNIGQAQNEYQRAAAASAFGRQQGDVVAQYAQMRERLPYNYAARGLLNSGVYQKGLADYAKDRTRAIGNIAGAYADQTAGFDLAQRQLGQVKNSAWMDLDEQEQSRIAATAAALRAAR